MTPTPPTAPTPPPGPIGTPTAPGAGPPQSGGNVWLVGFIVAAVLLVLALVFGIWSFVGKNSESDKKDKAQTELAKAKESLGTSEAATNLLARLVTTGETAGTDLKACADSDTDLETAILNQRNALRDALNQAQGGANIDPLVPGLNAQFDTVNAKIDANKRVCDSATSSFKDFTDALTQLKNAAR
jgi:flagellar basal body-associated protein FliL